MVTNDNRNPAAVHLSGVGVTRSGRAILEGISWEVCSGEQAAILGPNGAGKSTLTRILLGYLWPTRGEVIVAGRKFGESNMNELRTIVRLVQPNGPFDPDPNLTVRQIVYTGFEGTLGVYTEATQDQLVRVEEMISRVGVSHVADSLYMTLSTGERVRTLVARALVSRPSVLILDEPTAGLDIAAREALLGVIDDLSASPSPPAVIMVTHHVEELPANTQNVLLLDNGKTSIIGTPDQVLTAERLTPVYRCPVDVRVIEGRYYLHAKGRPWL